MSGAVIVRRCASAEEAAIVCALLNDAGIPASLENWNHAMMDWGSLQALGGVGVRVPAGQLEAARAAIIGYAESAEARLKDDFPDLETVPSKPKRFRHLVLMGYYTGALLLPIIILIMLIEVYVRAAANSYAGLDWPLVRAELYAASWTYLAIWAIGAACYFLVPLTIFVFLARRFLARRAALKATT